jgi:hypothetical protein
MYEARRSAMVMQGHFRSPRLLYFAAVLNPGNLAILRSDNTSRLQAARLVDNSVGVLDIYRRLDRRPLG